MYYWLIALGFLFVGTAAAWMMLTHLWNKYDRFTVMMIPQLRMGHPIPGEYNYWDLRFSLLRHATMFIVTAAVMYWAESRIILTIFFFGYTFYTSSLIVRYLQRKDYINNLATDIEMRALADLLTKPLKDSRVVMIYSICASVITVILYGIRP